MGATTGVGGDDSVIIFPFFTYTRGCYLAKFSNVFHDICFLIGTSLSMYHLSIYMSEFLPFFSRRCAEVLYWRRL